MGMASRLHIVKAAKALETGDRSPPKGRQHDPLRLPAQRAAQTVEPRQGQERGEEAVCESAGLDDRAGTARSPGAGGETMSPFYVGLLLGLSVLPLLVLASLVVWWAVVKGE